MKKYRWACPGCGENRITLVQQDAIAATIIVGFDEQTGEPVYDPKSTEVTECFGEEIYECDSCGYVICTGKDEDFMDAMRAVGAMNNRRDFCTGDNIKVISSPPHDRDVTPYPWRDVLTQYCGQAGTIVRKYSDIPYSKISIDQQWFMWHDDWLEHNDTPRADK